MQEKCHWCSNKYKKFDVSRLSVHSTKYSLSVLSGAVRSGCCDYQSVMNALLMCPEQLDSASVSLGGMTATVGSLTETLTFTSTGVFFSRLYRSSLSSFTHAGANVQVHPYICYLTLRLPQPSYYAQAALHVLFINDRG